MSAPMADLVIDRSSFAQRHWYRLSALSLLLLPVALLYGIVGGLRRALYRIGVLPSRRLPVPVIIIGNVTAGGTGKTPLVLWVAELLRAAGRHPGIVLRGYRAASQAPRGVTAGDDATDAGDEALLLAQRAGCPVWAGQDRVAAAEGLLAAHPRCDVLICDDGLQHYRLQRDLEIAVEDSRGRGNGLLLPAGPLREPATRRVDAVVVNADGSGGPPQTARAAVVFGMKLDPAGLETLDGKPADPAGFAGRRLHAVAGIGNPDRFFDTLKALGLDIIPHAFGDHHAFVASDLDFGDGLPVLMTEKDAVKCRAFARENWMLLRVRATPDPALAPYLLKALHGRTTA